MSDPSSPFGLPPLHVGKIPDPPKRGRMLDFRAMTHGCLVSDPEMARRLGDTYLEILYGTEERDRQQPLVASEQDDCWRIEGSWNRLGSWASRVGSTPPSGNTMGDSSILEFTCISNIARLTAS